MTILLKICAGIALVMVVAIIGFVTAVCVGLALADFGKSKEM